MSKVVLYFIFLFFAVNIAEAQLGIPGQEGICIDGRATMYIAPSTTLHVDGNFFIKKSQGPSWVRSNGIISLTGNLICNDPLICERADSLKPTCKFIFRPKTPTVSISGTTDSIIFYHTIINKPNTIVKISPGMNIKILDTLDLQAGSFRLDSGNIYFLYPHGSPSYINHPYLKNENNQNRIFGDSGMVVTTMADISSIKTPANLGLTVKGPDVSSDSLTIKRVHTKQIYAGNGSIRRYFDVVSNQLLNNDSLFVSYIDSAEYINLGINKNKLKIFASHGSDMNYYQPGGSTSLPHHMAKAVTDSFSAVGINTKNFRVTVADEGCNNPPVSALPNGILHLCPGVTRILDAGNNTSIPNTSLIWRWNTGASTQTITVSSDTSTQTFIVTLRDVRGCITKDTVIIAPTAPAPTINFTAYSKCFSDSVKLISTSSIPSGIISNYNWKFGDGDSLNTPLHDTIKKLYASSGKFYVTLKLTSNYGCIASKIDSVWSFPLPTAGFTSNFNCAGDSMKFTSNSIAGFGSIQTNYWNFDTASSASLTAMSPSINPSHNYSPPGTYYVKLLVETFQGCKDSTTKNIVINPNNSSAFTASNSCLGDTITFINSSICNTGSCNYLWDFGDGTQSIALNPKKIFAAATVYNVKLKIMSSSGCADSSSVPIIISPKPVINFSSGPVCFGNVSYFTSAVTITTGSIVSYAWDLGNSTTSTNANTFLTYTNPGSYNVSLTAVSNLGCAAGLTKSVSVFPKPVAQYNVSNVCLGQASVFNQNSIGSPLAYSWNFGNLNTSAISNPSCTYASSGNYSTSLIVTDTNNCSDTSSITTTVFSIPNPGLGGIITTCGTSYILNAGPGVSYLWQPVNTSTQYLTVTSNGTYSVTVTDTNGCIGADQVLVGLNTEVKPHLGNDTTSCGPYLINAGYPGSTYLWSTGASTQTILAATPAAYSVTVTDINNCIGKDTVNVLINTPPTLSLGPDITQCKTSQPVTLSAVTNANIYLWNNGSAQSSLNINNSGSYALTVTGGNGCKKSDTITVNLLPSPIVDLGLDAAACGTKLLDAQNAGYNFLWSNGNTSQTISASANGAYWVTVTNPSNGCAGKDSINLIINTPINLFLGNDTTACSNAAFVLNAGNTGATYSWSTGDTTQTIIAESSGSYAVTVSSGACSSIGVIHISVLNAPVVDLGNHIKYICSNGSITLDAGNSGTVIWGSSNGFSSALPIITTDQAGTYWAVVSNGICSSSDTVQVIQSNQDLTAYFIASTVDTVGKSIKFVDVSLPVPTNWLWDFGDGFNSTIQSPEHIFLTVQTFNVTLTVSNGFCTSQIKKSLEVKSLHPLAAAKDNSLLTLVNFSLYPNPADKSFKTVFELNDDAAINFSLYEITGKLVYQQNRNQAAIFNEETDITGLKNGLYLIEIIAESNKGFVIQKGKLLIMK